MRHTFMIRLFAILAEWYKEAAASFSDCVSCSCQTGRGGGWGKAKAARKARRQVIYLKES